MSLFKVRSGKPTAPKTLTTSICAAIEARRQVVCVYESDDVRTIEPYCHGHSKAGNELLSAYQIAGPTDAGWKMFDVAKLTRFEISAERFDARSDFNSSDPGMAQIHCQFR